MDELERIKKEKMEKMLKKGKDEMEIEVNDSNFEQEVIEKSKKISVVVDFWAEWCAPCFVLSPILEKLAKEYNGKFILAKVNIDGARSAAQKYGIMSIPNVKMFKDGKVIDEFIGTRPEEMVKGWLDKNL